MAKSLPEFIAIGYIQKAHGIRGQVTVKPLTDYPPRFKELKSVIVEPRNGLKKQMQISEVSVRENAIYLGFEDVSSREEAEALKGATLYVPLEEVRALEEGNFYHFEVIGFVVKTTGGRNLGRVEDVLDLPANAVFVVKNQEKEYLIPLIKDVVKKIHKEAGEIIIEPIEGLLE